jgi:hypothetical protein
MSNMQIAVTKPYRIASHNFRVPHNYTIKEWNIEQRHTKLDITILRFHKIRPYKNETPTLIKIKLHWKGTTLELESYRIDLIVQNHMGYNFCFQSIMVLASSSVL